MHRTALHKNYLAPNVNSAKVGKHCSWVRCPDSPHLSHLLGISLPYEKLMFAQQKLHLLVRVIENNYKWLGGLVGVGTETEVKTDGWTHRRENQVNSSDR